MTIGAEAPFCIIGERINPTGRKMFAEQLRNGDLSTVNTDALAQVDAGADMLDVNAGIPLVDESELANDETGIPETPQKRLECARKIVSVAGDHGIAPEDVIIDPLAMTVGADTEAVTITLNTIRLIRDELGVTMCLGASNVSFGLPQRHALGAAFLPMAMAAGLTSAIMSTAPLCVEAVRAADLLLGHDPWGASCIAAHRARQAAMAQETAGAV